MQRVYGLPRLALSRHIIPWLNLLFVTLLAYNVAGVSWRLWPQSAADGGMVAVSFTSSPSAKTTAALDEVATMHLFGEAQPDVKPVEDVVDAPETRLSLTLRGIVAVSAGSEGRALIAEGAADEKVYKVGDSLTGGAVLHEVLSDKVILKRSGRLETLTLPRDRLSQEANFSAGRHSRNNAPLNVGQAAPVSEQLRTLRDSVVTDPQQAFDMVQAQPVMEGGTIKGYRVSPGKERRLFQSTGLRPGDVVTQVNGITVGDTAQLATLYEQFKTANRFDLMVERGGRQTKLTINLGN